MNGKPIDWKNLTNDQRNHLIAQEVLGLVPCETGWTYVNAGSDEMCLLGECPHQKVDIAPEGHRRTTSNCYPATRPSGYVDYVSAAFEVVEFVRNLGFEVDILACAKGEWAVYFHNYSNFDGFSGRGELPTAICIAALRVKGFEVLD